MLIIVNGDHLCVGVAHIAEIVDVVGFVVGLVGTGTAVTPPMMSAYLNQTCMVIG